MPIYTQIQLFSKEYEGDGPPSSRPRAAWLSWRAGAAALTLLGKTQPLAGRGVGVVVMPAAKPVSFSNCN